MDSFRTLPAILIRQSSRWGQSIASRRRSGSADGTWAFHRRSLGTCPDTLHAAILRSPHPHADVVGIDTVAARGANAVAAVLTGDDVKALTSSLVVGVKASVDALAHRGGAGPICGRAGGRRRGVCRLLGRGTRSI